MKAADGVGRVPGNTAVDKATVERNDIMIKRVTKLAMPLALFFLFVGVSNAFAAATGITPNSGPNAGGQVFAITGTTLDATTAVTINGVSCPPVTGAVGASTSFTATEAWFKTGNIGTGGTFDVVVTGGGAATLAKAYMALKTANHNMLQVVVSATAASVPQIAWDTGTTEDDAGLPHAVDSFANYTWIVRDAALSGPVHASGAAATGYFVDLGMTYAINDADNAQALKIKNASRITSTDVKLYATAQKNAGVWALGATPGSEQFSLSATDDASVVKALGLSPVKLTAAALDHSGPFTLVLTYKTPTSTASTAINTATVQITGTL